MLVKKGWDYALDPSARGCVTIQAFIEHHLANSHLLLQVLDLS